MREQLEALWRAANDHSTIVFGEWIDPDHEGEDYPPAPSDDNIIRLVTEYLNTSR